MVSKLMNLIPAFVMAASTVLTPLPAGAQSQHDPLGVGGMTPEGRWASETGDSRYEVTLCGDDGVSLCGKLIWIRPRDRNQRNVQFVDTWVVREAARTRPLEWKGTLSVYGTEYGGTVSMTDWNTLRLTACVFILCETQEYRRLRNPDGSRVAERD